jgi:hypothetical protein
MELADNQRIIGGVGGRSLLTVPHIPYPYPLPLTSFLIVRIHLLMLASLASVRDVDTLSMQRVHDQGYVL